MNLYSLVILCFGFCSLLLGLLVWLKREDKIGKRYFGMAFFYSAWAVFIAINLNNDVSPSLGLFMGRLGNCFAIFVPVTWYHFVVTYTDARQKRFLTFCYIVAVLVSPWFIPRVVPMVGFKYYSQAGPLYYVFTLMFCLLVPLSFIELYKKIETAAGPEKEQIRGVFLTSLIGFIGGSPTFFPIYGIPFPQYTLLLLPIYPFGVAYFMIKQKLFDVNALADAIQEAKLTTLGVIASSINHEIRNPIFVIKGLAETLAERAGEYDSGKIKEVAQRAVAQAERALGIIKNFSLYARRQTDQVYEKQPVNIGELIERILPFVESELDLKGITIVRNIPEGTLVVADRQSLEEIFVNLLVNACQSITGSGTITVTASLTEPGLEEPLKTVSSEGKKHQVLISIEDTGCGIAPEHLSRVFEPFYTTKPSGTGLGLYVVKRLVERNNGRISVESSVGQGTVFAVIFDVS
ncbi:MAG TPA: ATP-binding protein [Candidatus Omnitrophota bacterium]|nr:ATP-binding protein [Candidatus Omnitrophota bacterium]